MTNLSAKTARRLKEAGFPQPTPAVGQWWYLGENLQFLQTRHIEAGGVMIGDFCIFTPWSHVTKSLSAAQVLEFCAYCPADAELLAALGGKFRAGTGQGGFVVWSESAYGENEYVIFGDTLSHCLSSAWLQTKEK